MKKAQLIKCGPILKTEIAFITDTKLSTTSRQQDHPYAVVYFPDAAYHNTRVMTNIYNDKH
jgi:hypothetical protein